MSINVCAVFRRGMHIAETLGALGGHWPDTGCTAHSRGLLTFYHPTSHSPRPSLLPLAQKFLKHNAENAGLQLF